MCAPAATKECVLRPAFNGYFVPACDSFATEKQTRGRKNVVAQFATYLLHCFPFFILTHRSADAGKLKLNVLPNASYNVNKCLSKTTGLFNYLGCQNSKPFLLVNFLQNCKIFSSA